MKNLVMAFAIAVTFTACNNNAETNARLKQEAIKAVRDSIRLDSFERAEAKRIEIAEERERILAVQAASRANYASTPAPRRTYVKGVSETYTYSQPQATKKKGWSSAAKGAVIGAGAGAVTGILVDKKDARGAIIGGVLGAGTGYVIGRSKDKRTGRVQ